MTTVTPGAVEVRQEDREAYLSLNMLPEFDAVDVRAGRWDHVTGVQAFARHRIAATPPDALQTVVGALREARRIIAEIDEYMKRPGRGDWGEECACCMGELLDDDREAIARIDAALSLAGGDV